VVVGHVAEVVGLGYADSWASRTDVVFPVLAGVGASLNTAVGGCQVGSERSGSGEQFSRAQFTLVVGGRLWGWQGGHCGSCGGMRMVMLPLKGSLSRLGDI
jgi:hypothetical protein